MKVLYTIKITFNAALISLATTNYAQSEVDPSSDLYTFEMEPFSAEYAQMGSQLLVTTSLSADGTIYNISMSMPDLTNRARVITDVIGISAKDGSFIYRDFHLPVPSWTFNRAEFTDGNLSLQSFSAKGSENDSKASTKPVFDGTFAYWQLAGIDKSTTSFVLNRWKKTPQELVVGMSKTPFTFVKEEQVSVGDSSYTCKVYTVEAAPGTNVICYVSEKSPYLIKQEYQQGDGNPMPIMTLTKVLK